MPMHGDGDMMVRAGDRRRQAGLLVLKRVDRRTLPLPNNRAMRSPDQSTPSGRQRARSTGQARRHDGDRRREPGREASVVAALGADHTINYRSESGPACAARVPLPWNRGPLQCRHAGQGRVPGKYSVQHEDAGGAPLLVPPRRSVSDRRRTIINDLLASLRAGNTSPRYRAMHAARWSRVHA
jgi:hypothetical protein